MPSLSAKQRIRYRHDLAAVPARFVPHFPAEPPDAIAMGNMGIARSKVAGLSWQVWFRLPEGSLDRVCPEPAVQALHATDHGQKNLLIPARFRLDPGDLSAHEPASVAEKEALTPVPCFDPSPEPEHGLLLPASYQILVLAASREAVEETSWQARVSWGVGTTRTWYRGSAHGLAINRRDECVIFWTEIW